MGLRLVMEFQVHCLAGMGRKALLGFKYVLFFHNTGLLMPHVRYLDKTHLEKAMKFLTIAALIFRRRF